MDISNLPEKEADIYKKLARTYKMDFDTLKLRGRELQILQVADIEPLLGGKDPFEDVSTFPFWVRLWESAILLADLMLSQPVEQGATLLELGAGLGAPGLAAAANGYRVTLSDYESHILDFERVSAAVNRLENVDFTIIDWKNPPELPPFDTIIGAEILFREDFFEPLLNLFRKYLKPGGVVYLAHDVRRKSLNGFLSKAEEFFEIAFSTRKMQDDEGEKIIVLNRLTQRS